MYTEHLLVMRCLQLKGYNLVPFNFDKQMVMLTSVYNLLQYADSPNMHACGFVSLAACYRCAWQATSLQFRGHSRPFQSQRCAIF